MKLIDRIENANSIANGLKPNEIIDAKVIYDLQLHLSEAIELVKDLTIPIVSKPICPKCKSDKIDNDGFEAWCTKCNTFVGQIAR